MFHKLIKSYNLWQPISSLLAGMVVQIVEQLGYYQDKQNGIQIPARVSRWCNLS
jgi:hypothetical protein